MLLNHIKIAFRTLRKNRLTTSLNIIGLAVGFAVCLFVGLWMQYELSFDRFHADAGRIFRLTNTFKSETESFSQAPCGPAFGAHIPLKISGVTSATRVYEESGRLEVDGKVFQEPRMVVADANFFRFFSFEITSGDPDRFLTEPGNIVLTEKTAMKYFGDENPVGKPMRLDGAHTFTVSGVVKDAPAASQIQFDLVLPMAFLKKLAAEEWGIKNVDGEWLGGWMMTFVKLANPTDAPTIEKQINDLLYVNAGDKMDSLKMSYTYHIQPLTDVHLSSNLRYDAENNGSLATLRSFVAVGLIVLLLACINYINLATASAVRRAKETGVRKVNGAARSELVQQFLVESLLTAFVAGGLGWLFFQLGLPGFERLTGHAFSGAFSAQVIGLLAIMSLAAGLLAGVYPALVISGFQPAGVLKGAFQTSFRGVWLRKSLVVAQFSASVALLVAVCVIWRQMNFVHGKSLGFKQDALLEVNFFGAPEIARQTGALRNELLSNHAVSHVAFHRSSLVGGLGNGWTTTVDLTGKEISSSLYRMAVSPEFFETYDLQLAAGRFLSGDFPTDTTKSVMINEAAVRAFGWQTPENALGKPFGKGEQTRTVVGVVRDFHFENLHKPVEPLLLGFSRFNSFFSVKIEAAQISEAIRHIEKTWQNLAPGLPLKYQFVDEKIGGQYAAEQTIWRLFLMLSGLAIFIACLGLFGLATHSAQQRAKEIGIRKVLGASVAGITGLLAKDFLKLVTIAIVIASPVAYYFMDKWLADFAYRIDIQWWMFAIAGVGAVAVAFLTVSFQSVKAALANPVDSLRSE